METGSRAVEGACEALGCCLDGFTSQASSSNPPIIFSIGLGVDTKVVGVFLERSLLAASSVSFD